ncbi:MAG: HU family DNA-binding protein [Planctomycetota bacterium]
MNKSILVDRVASKLGVSKIESARMIDAVLASLVEGVRSEGRVTLSGFGTFLRRERQARHGINPSTREPMVIPPSATCVFRPAPALRDHLLEAMKESGRLEGIVEPKSAAAPEHAENSAAG